MSTLDSSLSDPSPKKRLALPTRLHAELEEARIRNGAARADVSAAAWLMIRGGTVADRSNRQRRADVQQVVHLGDPLHIEAPHLEPLPEAEVDVVGRRQRLEAVGSQRDESSGRPS